MSDLFHKDVPLEYIQEVFAVMRRARWHRFQVLTKRADRLAELSSEIDWPRNVWMGVSVESSDHIERIDDLRATGAHVKFLSLEPHLGPLKWGGKNKKKAGRVLEGKTYGAMPETAPLGPIARAPRAQRSLPVLG